MRIKKVLSALNLVLLLIEAALLVQSIRARLDEQGEGFVPETKDDAPVTEPKTASY